MLDPETFYNFLIKADINFFCGVPDSLLKSICAKISDSAPQKNHIITANEGSAIGLASGYHFATSKIPFVYMQNSGLGNTVNPLTSLTAPEVYGVPMILLIGWRGSPGEKDEPQHMKKGKITLPLLEIMNIPYEVLPENDEEIPELLAKATKTAKEKNTPVALVVKKGTFSNYSLKTKSPDISTLSRERAIEIILEETKNQDAVYIGNTGKIGRELFEVRKARGEDGNKDFLNVGSMGHTSQIALGIAMNTTKKVYCLDGDGAMIMHMGGLATIGDLAPINFIHIILNNAAHDSVGGQPTVADKIDFPSIAKACGYEKVITVDDELSLKREISSHSNIGPSFIEIRVSKGARKNLARPDKGPSENKKHLMEYLQKYKPGNYQRIGINLNE